MSLSGALSVALSGLQTSTTVAQLLAGNISNAQTKGYTSKTINLTAIASGVSIGGVEISGYSRATNEVLSATLNSATTSSGYLSTQNNYMSQVQSILDSTGNPPALSADISAFQAAWTQYEADPSSVTQEQTIITTGQTLANLIASISRQTRDLETSVQSDLATSITELNSALEKVKTLNYDISMALANKQPTVDLEDQRDQAINVIAEYTNVKVLDRANDQIALYTSDGVCLLDGIPQKFTIDSDGYSILNTSGANVTSSIIGGSLQAQTDFLSPTATTANGVGVITKLKSQLQNFANLFLATTAGGKSFADTYNSAATSTGELASGFFTATINSGTGLPSLDTFAVNASLVNGTSSIKKASATSVNSIFSATDAAITVQTIVPAITYATSSTFQAAGLSLQNQTYSGIATGILSGFQQAANIIKNQNTTAATQKEYYESSLSNETGVNTDEELINLTNWENSYSASAHVISTIQSMMNTLQEMVG